MSDRHSGSRASFVSDRPLLATPTVVASLSEADFARASLVVPDLAAYADFEDWRCAREARQIGLAMAGVDAPLVCVSLTGFLAWVRLTGSIADEAGLDRFAATLRAFRTLDEPFAFAVVSERDFAAHSPAVAALSGHGDFLSWSRFRRSTRVKAKLARAGIIEVPISIDEYVAWRACIGDNPAATIDRFAQAVLEHFASDFSEGHRDSAGGVTGRALRR